MGRKRRRVEARQGGGNEAGEEAGSEADRTKEERKEGGSEAGRRKGGLALRKRGGIRAVEPSLTSKRYKSGPKKRGF